MSQEVQIKLFEPSEPQRKALKVLHEDKPFITCLNYGRQTGKAQPLDSKLYTENGEITMRDVKVGDKIFGSKGLVEVIAIHPQGLQDTYKVSFDDGTSVKCNLEHLWEVIDHHGTTRVLSVKELLKIGVSNVRPKNGRTYNKFKVRIPKPLEFNNTEIFDYYYFGLWLGDGTTIRPNEITTADEETVEYLKFKAEVLGLEVLNKGYKYILKGRVNKNPIINKFKDLGVVGNKHIPDSILYSTIDDRMQVLRGIMDSDGTIDDRGSTELVTKLKRLRDDYLALARGLGFHASYKTKVIDGKEYYRINIRYNGNFDLFSLERKRSKHSNALRASAHKFITNIEKLDYKTEQQCITVSGEDSLYVTDGYNLTHNSYLALMDAITRGMNQSPTKPIFINFIVPTYQLAVKHMQKIDMLFQGHEEVKAQIFKAIKYKLQEYHFHNGTILTFLSADAEDNLRGGTCHFMYIDEAAFIKETTYTEILLPMLTQTGGRILMFSTPNGKNWFYKLWKKGRPEHKEYDPKQIISLRADYRDLKDEPHYREIVNTIEAMRLSMTKDSFNREVLAQFVSDQTLFHNIEEVRRDEEWYEEYKRKRKEYVNGVRVHATKAFAGIDIGVVDDYTVITIVDTNFVVLDILRFNLTEENLTHSQFKQKIKDFLMYHREHSGLQMAYMEVNNKELLYEELAEDRDLGMFLYDFRTSGTNKGRIVEGLIKLFDDKKIRIPINEDLEEELYAFQSVQSPISGVWQYRGSDGTHDDMVMSMCIAFECLREETDSGFTNVY